MSASGPRNVLYLMSLRCFRRNKSTVPACPYEPRATLTREQLEAHASGAVSAVFGALFEQQDHYPVQVRMPMPPLLLADRVVELRGEPGSLGTGSVCTETDVTADAWYLHAGR